MAINPTSVALGVKASLKRETVEPSSRKPEDPIVAEARERWGRCDEHEAAQRKSILIAKKFRSGDQWEEAVKLARAGASSIQGQAAEPPRPFLTIDRLSPPCRQASNAIKNADFGIDVLPNGYGADDETAQLFEGYFRRMQILARAESPVEWAADSAIEGGLGWFRLRTEYVHETWDGQEDDPQAYDQELRLERIVNNLTVYCDPAAQKPTRSDAEYMFVTEDLSKEEFRRRWPKADYASLEDFSSLGDNQGWVSEDNVRIAEYWRIRWEPRTLTSGNLTRILRTPLVEMFLINAVEVLERSRWLGSRIPIIPVLGEEIEMDGKVILQGIIQKGIDAQRMVNWTYSSGIEAAALGNKSQFIVEEQQIADYQQIWQQANTKNYSYLPYRAVPNAPPPQRQTAEAPIQSFVGLMQISEEAIKATTGFYDPSLGNIDPRAHSGRAIQALQSQSENATSHFANNVTRALVYAAMLGVEIIPKITRVGQLLHIVGDDDEPEEVIIGQPFQQQNGRAVPSSGVTPEQAKLSKGLHRFYDLKNGTYAVTVTAGKASATKREEGAAALKDLIPHLPPEMAMAIMPDYVRQLSFEGSEKIATKIEKALPPALQPQEEGGPDPKLQQAMQQIQQLQQMIQSKQAEKQAEVQAKGAVDFQKTQLQELAENQRAEQANQTALERANIAAVASMSNAQAKVDAENFRSYVDAVETRLAKQEQLHLEHFAKLHEAVQQLAGHAHDVGMAHLEHQHALEQGQQAAALAPEPAPASGAE